MALSSRTGKDKKKTAAKDKKTEAATPEVETQEPVETPEATTPEPAATPETAVVPTQTAPPPAIGGAFKMALGELRNVLPAMEFGTLPRIKPGPGTLMCEGTELGKEAEVTVISYNENYAVAPQEDGAPNELCKFSYDNITLNDGTGRSVEEYLRYLREEEGWKNAGSKRYFEVTVMLEDAEEDHEELGNMCTLSLSPMSVKQFERYQLQTTVKIKQGKTTPEAAQKVRLKAKNQTFGSNSFTMITFSQAD